MPHAHGVIWLKEETVKPYLKENGEFDLEKVPELIDFWTSCSLDTGDEDLNNTVKEVNVHHHTKSCQKKGFCRFNFPRLPSKRTIIATPLEMPENETTEEKKLRTEKLAKASKLLSKVKDALIELGDNDEDIALEDFISQLGITLVDYENALKISSRGNTIILKRKVRERMVNNYNGKMLKVWQANMDIQVCLDNYAIVTYVCDYLTKTDEGLTKFMKEAIKEKKSSNAGVFEKLNYVKQIYFTHRQVCEAEAVYRLSQDLHLKGSNVATTFLTTGFPQHRNDYYINISNDTEDTSENYSTDKFKIDRRSGTFVKVVSIHKKYEMRPVTLEDLCLAQFASSYSNCVKPKRTTFQDSCSEEKGNLTHYQTGRKLPKYIILENGVCMKLRETPYILRIHASKKKQGHEEYYAELLLYYPFRNELNDLSTDENICLNLFLSNFEILKENRQKLFPFSNEIDEMKILLESSESTRPEHIFDTLDPEGQQENLDLQEDILPVDDSELPAETEQSKSLDFTDPDYAKFKPLPIKDDSTMKTEARQLSFEQRIIFDKIIKFCKEEVIAKKCGDFESTPPLVLAHGGAGVGKTYLIKTLSSWIQKISQREGLHPLQPHVLLLAPTGVAANNIGGTTLHSGLDFKIGKKYIPLSSESKQTMSKLLENVKVLIIDELSMISADLLYDVNKRMQSIMTSEDPFGGVAVVLLGDILQLPPIRGEAIFLEPRSEQNLALYNSEENLWNNFEVVVLECNFRQGKNEFTEVLNKVRVGNIDEQVKKLLTSRQLRFHPESVQDNATHTYFANRDVEELNTKQSNKLSTTLRHLKASIRSSANFKAKLTPHGTIENTNFLQELYLKIGSRIMVIYNVNIPDGLVNGQMGTVIGFEFYKNSSENVEAVIVSLDDVNAGTNQIETYKGISWKWRNQNGIPIFRSKFTAYKPSKRTDKGYIKYQILQFPLRLSWAATCHKLQGANIRDKNLICHGGRNLPSLIYVMISRVTSINHLFLDERIDINKITCNARALEENNSLNERSIVKYVKEKEVDIFFVNIQSLRNNLNDLKNDIYAKKSNFICLAETWLHEGDQDEIIYMEGWKFFHSSKGRGKGCCIFSKDMVECVLIGSFATEDFSIISVKIHQDIQLYVIYLSQTNNNMKEKLWEKIKEFRNESLHLMIVGDFNIDSRNFDVLLQHFKQYGLVQLVDEPTHIEGRIIDHLWVSKNLSKLDLKLQYPYYTQHKSLVIKLE